MADIERGFKTILDGIKLADEGRDQVMEGLEEALAGGTDLKTQLADLRESVEVLRGLIMEQGQEIKALRERQQ